MLKSLADFKMKFADDMMGLLMEYIEIKCTDYGEYDQFIFDLEYTHKDQRGNHLTVVYDSFPE